MYIFNPSIMNRIEVIILVWKRGPNLKSMLSFLLVATNEYWKRSFPMHGSRRRSICLRVARILDGCRATQGFHYGHNTLFEVGAWEKSWDFIFGPRCCWKCISGPYSNYRFKLPNRPECFNRTWSGHRRWRLCQTLYYPTRCHNKITLVAWFMHCWLEVRRGSMGMLFHLIFTLKKN